MAKLITIKWSKFGSPMGIDQPVIQWCNENLIIFFILTESKYSDPVSVFCPSFSYEMFENTLLGKKCNFNKLYKNMPSDHLMLFFPYDEDAVQFKMKWG